MFNTPNKVLVFGATGKQGGACVDALLAHGKQCEVHAIVRKPQSPAAKALAARGVTLHQGDFKSQESMEAAMRDGACDVVYLMTAYHPFKNSAKAETAQGISAINAIAAANPNAFVVFTSVAGAGKGPAAMKHIYSKAVLEKHLKESAIKRWFILRPVAFYESVDDKANGNPLKKGKVKYLTRADATVAYVSVVDVGRAAAAAIAAPNTWIGKTVTLAGGKHTGTEFAAALTEVSGTPSTYGLQVPRFLLGCLMPDLAAMARHMETGAQANEPDWEASKQLVPEIMDAKAFFRSKDAYANGEKFRRRPVFE